MQSSCLVLLRFFSSVGSTFEMFGCYGVKNLTGEGHTYVSTVLKPISSTDSSIAVSKPWARKIKVIDKALQLLYIVDIIELWAEHT